MPKILVFGLLFSSNLSKDWKEVIEVDLSTLQELTAISSSIKFKAPVKEISFLQNVQPVKLKLIIYSYVSIL
jgi:hypothetical protein